MRHLLQQPYGDESGREEGAQPQQVDRLGHGLAELVQQYRPGGLEGERKVGGHLDDVLVDAAFEQFDVGLDGHVGVVEPAGRLVQQQWQVFQGGGELVGVRLREPGRTPPDEGHRFVAAVHRHLHQLAVVLAPLRVARGDQDVAGAGGHQVPDLVGVVGSVEDEQPAGERLAAAQRVAHRAQPLPVLGARRQTEFGGEFGQQAAVGHPFLGVDPPHHVVLGAEPVHVFGGELGLPDPGHAEHRQDARAGLAAVQQVVGVVQERLAAGEAGVAARYVAPDLGHGGREARCASASGGLRQWLVVQVQSLDESSFGLLRADVDEVGGREDGGGGGDRRRGQGDGGEPGRVRGHDLAQRGVPLLVGAGAQEEVPVADEDEDAALGEAQIAQQVGQGDLRGCVPPQVHHTQAAPFQAVADPGSPGAVEPGEADRDGLAHGPPLG
ncbi:hypothetical protein GCM10010335_41810 [Streptomyces galbus]|nr:hypothetical protein GCM10010335_41810 [Streptomyces galbus]